MIFHGRFRRAAWFAIALSGGATGPMATSVRACLWDRDTLAMEQARFPGLLSVATGDFPRHSREYHEWRVARVSEQLARLPRLDPRGPALRDDLAVSLHKLGRHAEAVQTMEASLKLAPNRYETLSNLGTFTIYLGDLPASRAWLQKALAINPDAHFGREKYQLWLVELLMLRANAKALPEVGTGLPDYRLRELSNDYGAFIAWRQKPDRPYLNAAEIAAAIRGVTGMMRFADHDNPVLLEALGDLLKGNHPGEDAAHLGRLAYILAQVGAKTEADQGRLKAKIADAMSGYNDKRLIQLDALTKAANASTAQGATLAERIRADEIAWISAGADVDREFAVKYLKDSADGETSANASASGEEAGSVRVVFPVRK